MGENHFHLKHFKCFRVVEGSNDVLLYQSPEIPEQPHVDLNTGAIYNEGIRSYLQVTFSVSAPIRKLVCQRKVYKGPLCVNKDDTEMGDFDPREDPYEFNFAPIDTPSGFFVRGKFSILLNFVDENSNLQFAISYPFEIVDKNRKITVE